MLSLARMQPTEAPAPSPEPPERTEGLTVSNPIRDGADAEVPVPPADDDAGVRRDALDLHHREALTRLPLTNFLEVATFVLFLVRVRRRIHVSLGRVTERFGLALCAFSVSCTAVKVSLLVARRWNDRELVEDLSASFTVAAFGAHLAMTLPHPRTRSL